MDKLKKSQLLKLMPIAALLIITPFLSTSLRSTYLYFIANILILVVGAEAGLLSFFLKSPENKKRASPPKPHAILISESFYNPPDHGKEETTPDQREFDNGTHIISPDHNNKIVINKVKKPSFKPSIFFIEGDQEMNDVNEREENNGEVINGQELFHKAETFIGNFYKQLKMQREDSWKKLHDIYHKAF